MEQKEILKCDLHDYLEIACLYSFSVKLEMKNGKEYSGISRTIKILNNKKEYLIFNKEDSKDTTPLLLTEIKSMTALTTNPHFSTVTFC